jgi:hypothetical protein
MSKIRGFTVSSEEQDELAQRPVAEENFVGATPILSWP